MQNLILIELFDKKKVNKVERENSIFTGSNNLAIFQFQLKKKV